MYHYGEHKGAEASGPACAGWATPRATISSSGRTSETGLAATDSERKRGSRGRIHQYLALPGVGGTGSRRAHRQGRLRRRGCARSRGPNRHAAPCRSDADRGARLSAPGRCRGSAMLLSSASLAKLRREPVCSPCRRPRFMRHHERPNEKAPHRPLNPPSGPATENGALELPACAAERSTRH
jgi:hypothetical protein